MLSENGPIIERRISGLEVGAMVQWLVTIVELNCGGDDASIDAVLDGELPKVLESPEAVLVNANAVFGFQSEFGILRTRARLI